MMKRLALLCSFLLVGFVALAAQTKADADSAYLKGRYEVAAQIYEKLLKQGDNAAVYYNLGNTYYRRHDIARAILNYERAALLDPGNSDIRFNLSLARSKTVDKMADTDQFFIVYWFYSLVNCHSTDVWGLWALVCFALLAAAILVALFVKKKLPRRVASYSCFLLLFLVVLFNVFAYVQRTQLFSKSHAVVMENLQVKSTPDDSGNDLFQLHPGTKVEIIDNTLGRWKEVSLPDGKKGWLKQSDIELI